MYKVFSCIVSIIVVGSACAAFAQEPNQKRASSEARISGELVDLKCYLTSMNKAKGAGHKDCAVECIKAGLPAGIVQDSTQELYLVLPKAGMDGHNDELAQFAGENVTLTGTVLRRNNQNVFLYSRIESSK
ncbi:MAG TPA: hypothetical protein VMH23_14500 [Bacteroidota bacterium]|nr:hypothetical protein [Bacteroidota bacterium]